uniref:PDZ domain-containing protein n=1 Tax=Neolamprologus brichardi TaxID=32507 RepID=A0A3Q4MI36_NEOBR
MKVTVTFGDTSVVVPCKAGWTVRDLIEQATRRYRRILEQRGETAMQTHHLEYMEGGILDMDDLLSDLVEDRDKVRKKRTDSNSNPDTPAKRFLSYVFALCLSVCCFVLSFSSALLCVAFFVVVVFLLYLDFQDFMSLICVFFDSSLTRTVEFPGDRGPLGIHVVPYCSSLNGRPLGLHIKGIEGNSRSKKENLFKEDECIVQINDTPLQDKTFAQSQEVFRQAMGSPSVHVEVLPVANKSRYEKSFIGQLFTSDSKDSRPDAHTKTPEPTLVNSQPAESVQSVYGSLERASPTSTARAASSSPTTWPRSESPLASKSPAAANMSNLTGRKGGKKMNIDLKKGSEGLGFTVVTRDSSVQGPGPILVKSILLRGAAVKDGRLQPGDRILEVNGVDMTGRSQEELVAMLRSTKQGESVSLVVARQEDAFLPRELKGEDSSIRVMEDGREQLMYEIPLNETGSAGLGVSLKGNKSRETGEDLGIFIKSIIHGGAAYKDGRLCINDQMIAVNGESLLGRSNNAAMEGLRRSMSSEGNTRGTIQVVVLRAPKQVQQASFFSSQSQLLWHRGIFFLRAVFQKARASSPTKMLLYGHYGNDDEQQDFPPPPSPGTVEEMNREFLLNPSSNSHGGVSFCLAEPSDGGALGPTLGLMKSSSLESLQTAMSEAKQSHIQDHVPFHRPRPHMVRGRGCNQSFRIAIDKSYDGPSEDDDDMSEHSSGHETPASSSSRDLQGKCVNRVFLLRLCSCVTPLLADSFDPRYAEVQSGPATPDPSFLPDVEDDDSDPNYARISNFRQPPSPQSYISRTPSPAVPAGMSGPQQAPFEDIDGLYAKVNKSRAPPASQTQQQNQYMQARAAPGYEELDAARRRILEYDPNRVSLRDPYDYPTHSRPVPRDSGPNHYQDAPGASNSGRLPIPQLSTQQPLNNPRYHPSSQAGQQHRAALRQDVPPSPSAGQRGPERNPPDPRRKNPMIGAV